jgi:hypothetical protein
MTYLHSFSSFTKKSISPRNSLIMNENQEKQKNSSSKKRKHSESSDFNERIHKEAASNEQKSSKQNSLAGTRYGVLEEKVKLQQCKDVIWKYHVRF